MRACVVLTTVGNRQEARRLADLLIFGRLAACVTLLPGAVSHYRWKGRRRTSGEVVLLIKTQRRLWPRLLKALKTRHPYELPEILLLPLLGGSKEYLSWLAASLKK